tara:strand:+ start:1252 stop:1473 length:222 start_codon:yes stop_codon:yes gene_type:complete
MLLGSVSTGIDNRKIAQKKFVNFRWFKAIHPSLHFGFVGDNGQGESSFFYFDRMYDSILLNSSHHFFISIVLV